MFSKLTRFYADILILHVVYIWILVVVVFFFQMLIWTNLPLLIDWLYQLNWNGKCCSIWIAAVHCDTICINITILSLISKFIQIYFALSLDQSFLKKKTVLIEIVVYATRFHTPFASEMVFSPLPFSLQLFKYFIFLLIMNENTLCLHLCFIALFRRFIFLIFILAQCIRTIYIYTHPSNVNSLSYMYDLNN